MFLQELGQLRHGAVVIPIFAISITAVFLMQQNQSPNLIFVVANTNILLLHTVLSQKIEKRTTN